jgi:hypothetical protein
MEANFQLVSAGFGWPTSLQTLFRPFLLMAYFDYEGTMASLVGVGSSR